MDDSFLNLVCKDILNRLRDETGNSLIIFPNQRPEHIFFKTLKINGYTGIFPQVLAIEKFVETLTGAKTEDSIDLLLILFKLYQKYYPAAEFDSFYSWGSMMLNDFDEIDRNLADPAMLFKNLTAVKDLEKYFLQDETLPFEMLPDLLPEDEQYLTKRFLENWEVYEKLYFDFKTELSAQNKAYAGMNFRKLEENILKVVSELPFTKYIFIGFNAISKSEEVIIQKLIDENKALIYWDADKYFIENEREGSGYFIRKSMHNLIGYNNQLFGDQLLTESKNIHIIGAPMQVGQAKALGLELKKHFTDHKSESACIVLADDQMLSSVLYALPENIEQANLGTGYPLKFSILYSLFQSLADLVNNYRPESNSFYHKDVVAVLSHPLVRNIDDEALMRLREKIQKDQMIFISLRDIFNQDLKDATKSVVLTSYFKEVLSPESLHSYLYNIYLNLEKFSETDKSNIEPFELIFSEMAALLISHGQFITQKMYQRVFKEKVHKAASDIQNQNADDLQILGMLETRNLDFDTIFMLPVNEGNIPEKSQNRSYIPFDIRRNFGLPIRDEQENIYAYNFYRLLQRATNIYLIYNSDLSNGGIEESRYIKQIEYYLPLYNPGIKIHRRFYGLPLRNNPVQSISIKKEKQFFDILKERNESGFSPSLISSYFICSLQFYFKNILKIPEKESVKEELEAKHFGILFHHLMDRIYEGLKGQIVNKELLIDRKSGLSITMNSVLDKLYGGQKESVILKNNILIETVKILAEKTLDSDIEYAPFKLIDTEVFASWEMPFNSSGFNTINLKGIIDRIDEKNGITRIVDYKTGSVKTYQFNYTDQEEHLQKENKEAFQTLFYGMLYLNTNPEASLLPSILPLREVLKGYIVVNEKDGYFSKTESGIFENKLKSVINTILAPDTLITQTDDLNICQFCSYKNFCMR